MNEAYMEMQDLGIEVIEVIEEIPEDAPPLNTAGWEVLTKFSYFFENADWQPVVNSVLLYNVPTDFFWSAWSVEKEFLKQIGFQVRPNQDEYAQSTDAKWLVYFDRHQHLDFLDFYNLESFSSI